MRRNVIDRMALLCTLHADGPKTLRLLREAGCTDLEKLGALGPERLSKLLRLSAASARRLLREADLLNGRLDPSLEREEVMYAPSTSAGAIKPPPPGSVKLEEDAEPAGSAAPTRSGMDLRDRALLDKVMERWRASDDAEEDDSQAAAASLPVQDPVPSAQLPELRAGLLPGLDATACAQLSRAGISSLEELATCPVDELSSRSGLGFTRARTLQFLAGRALASQGRERVATRARAEASPQPGAAASQVGSLAERLSQSSPEGRLSMSDRFGASEGEGPGGPFA
jgi:hypothetical protein